MLDDVSLVHMNGRVYDPHIGRFMSADPFVQAPTFSQSFNRYAYAFNSPLNYTDPTGYSNGWNTWGEASEQVKGTGVSPDQGLEEIKVTAQRQEELDPGIRIYNPDDANLNYSVGNEPGSIDIAIHYGDNTNSISQNSSSSGSNKMAKTGVPTECEQSSGGIHVCTAPTKPGGLEDDGVGLLYLESVEYTLNVYMNAIDSEARNAVDVWIKRDNAFMAGVAILALKENIGNTLSALSIITGANAARLFFLGQRALAVSASNISTGLSVIGNVITNDPYLREKIGFEVAIAVVFKVPVSGVGTDVYYGIQQTNAVVGGAMIGTER